MAFIIDKEELKPGLIIFRRSDVAHRNWYCRVKVPKADRYKTISLKTCDINAARTSAYREDVRVQLRIEDNLPIFNRPFRAVAKEYLATQEARAARGEISKARPKKLLSIIEGPLEAYCGSTQVHLIGQETWEGYPAWRRTNGVGRNKRNGVRPVSAAEALRFAEAERAARSKALRARGIRVSLTTKKRATPPAREGGDPAAATELPFISDSTIRSEMAAFGAVMNYAIKKGFSPASQRFDDRPKLKVMRRDEFTLEEYRELYREGRRWVRGIKKGETQPRKAQTPASRWYRTVAYSFILIMCNTGMRPSEAKNLRWRDVMPAQDGQGREIVALFVQGKGKSRKLVAPKSVSDYLGRIREISKATGPDDRVFTTVTGKPAKELYKAMVESLLDQAGLREGATGVPRSTYSFRHTYATFRLSEGVDVYFLAEQMGTSVKMIEDHYGHVNTIKHADRVLQGIGGWDPPAEDDAEGEAKAANAAKVRQVPKARRRAAQPTG